MKKRQSAPTHWTDIPITINGVEVTGSYSVDSTDSMTVRMTGGGTRRAHGGPAAEGVARIILGELYAEAGRAIE